MNKNIYVDVTCFYDVNFLSGIQRVVKEVTVRFLKMQDLNVFLFVWKSGEDKLSILNNEDYLACYDLGILDKKKIRVSKKILLSDIKSGDVLFDVDATWNDICHQKEDFLHELSDRGIIFVPFIHDIIPITHPEFFNDIIFSFNKFIAYVLEYADKIITSINATVNALSCLAKRINVVVPECSTSWLGADFKASESVGDVSETAKSIVAKGKYILYVGTIEPRKNHGVVLDAFDEKLSKLGINLIFAGRRGWGNEKVLNRIDMHPMRNNGFWFLEGESDATIQYLYKNAYVVVFSTFDEGFGLPLVESLVNGAVTIASDVPVMREIGGEYCEYFNPYRSEELSSLVEKYLENPNVYQSRKDLVSNYKPVLWDSVAENMKNAIITAKKREGPMGIIQVLSSFTFGDAIGNDAVAMEKAISDKGYKTRIYAESGNRFSNDAAKNVNDICLLGADDVIIYHMSGGTKMNEWIMKQPHRKIMVYHNITPPEFFEKYSPDVGEECKQGYLEAQKLKDAFDMVFADSEYNKQDLVKMGYKCPIHVLPILIPFEDYEKEPSAAILNQYENDGFVNIIFVGRVAPHKCQEDVIKAFYEYQKNYNEKSRLFIVGNGARFENYEEHLKSCVDKLGCKNVVFTGHIKFDEVLAYYRLSSLFLCQSEHEGFCVPLAEAMYFDKPIVAYDSSAISWTLGGSGVLLNKKDSLETAKAINKVLSDEKFKTEILEKQRKRLADFKYENVSNLFWRYMDVFLERK